MHGKTIEGRTLMVNPAKAKPDNRQSTNQEQGQARKAVVNDPKDDEDLPVGFALSSRVKMGNETLYDSDSDEEISFNNYPCSTFINPVGASLSASALSSTDTNTEENPGYFWGYVDSGCTSHLTPHKESLTNTNTSAHCPRFTVANGHQIKGSGLT
ncbi:hypothetical protein HDU67_000873, partial [Dinochytrium kinnereticum]